MFIFKIGKCNLKKYYLAWIRNQMYNTQLNIIRRIGVYRKGDGTIPPPIDIVETIPPGFYRKFNFGSYLDRHCCALRLIFR